MAMIWLAPFLVIVQAGFISSCVFDKVDEIPSAALITIVPGNLNECFAKCYEHKECVGIEHLEKSSTCYLFRAGDRDVSCKEVERKCYILQRDEMDPVCKTYVNF
ncbi:unnamed protein product [Cylicocyclus nassatus]|uniref:PAN-3 domain-containing protein n=1 Tax=Cylicocyclus nassatus TaxID=53992 RepID=A0AA36GSP7_CYLNA|nr:unnamed protein product [Cylicocyclus nassatus]